MVDAGQWANEHGDFIRRITTDHMRNGLVAARMILEPSIYLENMLFDDCDGPAICNKCLDFSSGHQWIVLLLLHPGGPAGDGCIAGKRYHREGGEF